MPALATDAARFSIPSGDPSLPLAIIKRDALGGNLNWMQGFALARGVDMAPHGKTTMSPQLLRRQLDAGARGITFATGTQARVGTSQAWRFWPRAGAI